LYGFQGQVVNLSLLACSGSANNKLLVSSRCRKRLVCLIAGPQSCPALGKLESLWNTRKGGAEEIGRRWWFGKLSQLLEGIAGKNLKIITVASFNRAQQVFLQVLVSCARVLVCSMCSWMAAYFSLTGKLLAPTVLSMPYFAKEMVLSTHYRESRYFWLYHRWPVWSDNLKLLHSLYFPLQNGKTHAYLCR